MRKIVLVVLSTLVLYAHAGTYRWVDADGRVTYGDRPPANGTTQLQNADASPAPPVTSGALPYALRSVASRFPVRLYTSRNCEVCETARAHLIQRGVPFTESLLSSERDLTEFRRLGFTELKVPAVSVGHERALGFGAQAWNALLDAAGYPTTSMLPSGWRPPAAESLASSVQPAPARAAPTAPGADVARDTRGDGSASAPQGGASPGGTPQAGGVPERPYAMPTATARGAPPPAMPAAAASSAATSAGSIRF